MPALAVPGTAEIKPHICGGFQVVAGAGFDSVGVEIFGELVAAEVADDVQYDPGNERVRS